MKKRAFPLSPNTHLNKVGFVPSADDRLCPVAFPAWGRDVCSNTVYNHLGKYSLTLQSD